MHRRFAQPVAIHRRRHRAVALGLSLLFFGLAVFATPASVRHALVHSRHTAAQHTTFVCTWICAATAFVQTTPGALDVHPAFRPTDPAPQAALVAQAAPATSARAPPA